MVWIRVSKLTEKKQKVSKNSPKKLLKKMAKNSMKKITEKNHWKKKITEKIQNNLEACLPISFLVFLSKKGDGASSITF